MESAPTPPPPPTFRSRVKRYTEDTRNVAAWLRQTASHCGYATSAASPSLESGSGKRAEYLIKTAEFIPMAEAIAAYKPKPTIPEDVLATISRAIRLRRRETRYVMSFGAKSKRSQLEDSTHTHFTERILGKVRDVLRPTGQPSALGPQTDTLPSLSDRLASLSTSDTDEADTIGEESFHNLTPVHIDFDDMEVEDEFFLAIDVFLEDLFFVRLYVDYIWTAYKESALENNVCSLLTNTAIDVVRLAEMEFDRLVKRPKRFPADVFPVWTLPSLLFYKRAPTLEAKFTYEEFASMTPIKLSCQDTEDQSDFALFSILSGLKWYLCADTKQEGSNHLDPAWFKQSGEDWHPHLQRVVEMCHMMQWQASAKLVPASQGKFDTIAEDEIARAVRYMVKHKEIPIWVQFAVQTYIDIQDVLSDRLDAPLKELQVCVQMFNNTVAEFLRVNAEVDKYETDPRFRKGYLKTIDDLKQRQSILDSWFTKDLFTLSLREGSHPCLSKFKHENHALLRRHPLGCGVLQYNMFEDLHELGLQLEWGTDCIRPMIYLYAATRLLRKDSPTWPDMELLILRQDPKRLFYGNERPANYLTILKCFERASGMSIKLRSKERALDPKTQHNSGIKRHITDPSMLTDVFMGRFDHQVSDNREIDSAVSKWAKLMSSEEGMKRLLRQRNDDPLEYTTAIHSLQKQAENSKPDGILSRLSPCLEADAIDLHFDWLSLHNTCALMWRNIFAKLTNIKSFLSFDPDQYRKTHRPQVSLVAQILQEAVHAYSITKSLELSDGSFAYGHSIRAAASVLQGTIKSSMSFSMYGQIMAGDYSVAMTMGLTSQHGVHYPSFIYEKRGPMNINKLYHGWDKSILKGLHATHCVKFADAKYKAFEARAEDERRRDQKMLEELLLEYEQAQQKVHGQADSSEHGQSSKTQRTRKKPKNHKKKGKSTTF